MSAVLSVIAPVCSSAATASRQMPGVSRDFIDVGKRGSVEYVPLTVEFS
jgi:hypothetical protein